MTLARLAILVAAFTLVAVAQTTNRSDISTALEERVGHGLVATDLQEPSSGLNIPPGVVLENGLTEEEAVALALWNNAALRATLGDLGLAQADLREAGLFVNPSFQVLFPIGIKPFEFLLTAPIQALWERPKRLAAAKLTLEGVSQQLVQNGLDLVRDTRLAYADYVAASEQAEVADRIADLAEEIAELNSRRLEAGDISELDLTLIRLEALAARDQAARLGQESEIGWERLRLIAGLPTATSASPPEGEVIALEEPRPAVELMEMATQSRPDLRAAELSLEAAGKRIGWERSKTFAVVSLLLSSKEVGDAGVKSGPGLSAEVPIFNYGQGRISRAVAEFEQLSLRYAALHVQIESETAGATARLQQAGSALRRLQNDLLPAAEEAVRLADEAYQSGDISYLDLQVARRPFLDLQLREGAAVAAARKAKAELDRAVGRNL